jgi:hypothetical protein
VDGRWHRLTQTIATYSRRAEGLFRALGIEPSERFLPGRATFDLATRVRPDEPSEQQQPDREGTGCVCWAPLGPC